MKFKNILVLLLFPFYVQAQNMAVTAGLYSWPGPGDGGKKNMNTVMLAGTAHDLAQLKVSANMMTPGNKKVIQVPATEEHLLLVKDGIVTITLNDSSFSIGKGSVAMIMPDVKYALQNLGTTACQFQLMQYTPKLPVNMDRGIAAGGSFVIDWNRLTFNPHERGGVRPYFDRPTANTRKFEMHVTTLKENFKSHDPHQHAAEEFIIVLEGNVEMLIGDKLYKANAGDVLFAPTNIFHGLKNTGSGACSYFAFQWE